MSETTLRQLISDGYLELGDGYRTKRAEHGKPGVPILRVAEVQDGYIAPGDSDYVSNEFRKAMGQKISRPGDIVLTTKGTVGRVVIMPDDGKEYVYSPQVCYFRISSGGPIVPRYLFYWLKSPEFWEQARRVKSQTDMADYISLTDIRSFSLTVPSRDVQCAITDVMGALDDKIAVNNRIARIQEELLCLRFLDLDMDVEPGPNGGSRVSDVVEFNPRLRLTSSEDAVYVDMAALPTETARVKEWIRRPAKSGARFMNGDTLMARITPCLENGKTAFVDFLADAEVGTGSTEFIVMRSRPPYPPAFSYFLARSARFRENAIRNMVGSSGRQRVSVRSLDGFLLRKPDMRAVEEFGRYADAVFAHVKSLDSESRVLAELRDALLPKLMSGEIKIRDAEKAVEEVT